MLFFEHRQQPVGRVSRLARLDSHDMNEWMFAFCRWPPTKVSFFIPGWRFLRFAFRFWSSAVFLLLPPTCFQATNDDDDTSEHLCHMAWVSGWWWFQLESKFCHHASAIWPPTKKNDGTLTSKYTGSWYYKGRKSEWPPALSGWGWEYDCVLPENNGAHGALMKSFSSSSSSSFTGSTIMALEGCGRKRGGVWKSHPRVWI